MRIHQGLLLIVCLLFISSCSRNPVTGKREFVLMSESQENSMGKQYDPEIIKMYGLYEDNNLQSYVTQKGKQVADISHRPNLDYQFRVLDSPVVNAFAVPGGYIYFTRGILAHFNNEAEFMGVMGHEVGHVAGRHTAKTYSRQTMMQVLFITGLIFSPQFRNFADLANQGISLLFLRFSRGHERESDKLGVEYSTELGYDSHEMAGFFKTLQALNSKGGALPEFLSTHPDPGSRFEDVNNYTNEVQADKGVSDANLKINRDGYLGLIDGLLYGEDPKQGFVENNVFYHPELLFQFDVPKGWMVNNTPSQVQLAPDGGKAVVLFELEPGSNLDQAANNVVSRNNIKVIESNNVNVNGNPAKAILGEFTPESNGQAQGNTLRVMTYLISYNNMIYKFIGLSEVNDFNAYFKDFQNTMTSFKKLTDQAKINKLPERIKIVTVQNTGTLQSALQAYGVDQSRVNELSLLNGKQPGETVQKGTKIKVLESRK